MQPVLVIGSSNTDMVIRVPELPAPGETVLGGEFQSFAGGKGANQAVAAARAGMPVEFFGAVGDDDLGVAARTVLENEGIGTDNVATVTATASGVALIFVSEAGENSIGVASGANACVSPDDIARKGDAIANAGIVLMQLETPMETITAAAKAAREASVRAVLNPAPAAELDDELLEYLYCVTPNAIEATALTGIEVSDVESATAAATVLINRGIDTAIITLGVGGALVMDGTSATHIPAPSVPVVDTTAAGDTFNGVLAAMLNSGKELQNAAGIAVAAASLSVQRRGAIAGIPNRDEYL